MDEMKAIGMIGSQKRKKEPELASTCLFCLKSKKCKEVTRQASDDGKNRVITVLAERNRLREESDRLKRLNDISIRESPLMWHSSCYCDFTAESRLKRLRSKPLCEGAATGGGGDSMDLEARSSRGKHEKVDWAKCIFCQDERKGKPGKKVCKSQTELHDIRTMHLSRKILELSNVDTALRIRLAGTVDLIAAEGKYHLSCLIKFEREAEKQRLDVGQGEDKELTTLCNILNDGLSRGYVYDMGEVWKRFQDLCEAKGQEIPRSYLSRRKTFTDAVSKRLGSRAGFIRPLNRTASLLLYPSERNECVISTSLSGMHRDEDSEDSDDGNDFSMMASNPLQEIVHSALQLRNDLNSRPGHELGWRGIDQDHVNEIIPQSLHIFLGVLFADAIEDNTEAADTCAELDRLVCDIAQDIIFRLSQGRKLTPKHIGLGMTVHQMTRSEALVDLLHASGHCISIDTIRRIDTSIANDILDRADANDGVFIPEVIRPFETSGLVLSSCDNIDVLEETIDGNNTTHYTQMAVWQRDDGTVYHRDEPRHIGRTKALSQERIGKMHILEYAKPRSGIRPSPTFPDGAAINVESWFQESGNANNSKSNDLAWTLSRILHGGESQSVPPWATFNSLATNGTPPVTNVGMLPILKAPADHDDTMTTVMTKFMNISEKVGQTHTVIFADQPLYSRMKELVWNDPAKYSNVICLLGHLHILFNYLKAIGQHYESAGLEDIWIEAGLFAPNTIPSVLGGKAYYRGVYGHICTYEALCRIRWTKFMEWLEQSHDIATIASIEAIKTCAEEVRNKCRSADGRLCKSDALSHAICALRQTIERSDVLTKLDEFDRCRATDPNFEFWTNYIKMVSTLLEFIRANREGDWQAHLKSFTQMLPWLCAYDHTNYARWGPVYLSDMKMLENTAPDVYSAFLAGNFVVQRSKRPFSSVPVDQATEWINRMCKISNGIIGITRNDTARDRFCLTWCERSEIALDTKRLLKLIDDEIVEEAISTRKEAMPGRLRHDEGNVQNLMDQFERFRIFQAADTLPPAQSPDLVEESQEPTLVSLTTNDLATMGIQTSLLSAYERGLRRLQSFVDERLVTRETGFFDTLSRINSKSFAHLYKSTALTSTAEKKFIKADAKLIQRLFNATRAGRCVDMSRILQHELSSLPSSLVKRNGQMNQTNKADMLHILTNDVDIETPANIPSLQEPSALIIDGHAMIQAMGKPSHCRTFADLGRTYHERIVKLFHQSFTRIDIVFDRYIGTGSIKSATRSKRGQKKRPIRKIIDRGDVPLPEVWDRFIALDQNKADLAKFVAEYLISTDRNYPQSCELIVGGGFAEPEMAKSTTRGQITDLAANHEEADTRMVAHAAHTVREKYKRVVVESKDTDVLLLLIHFFGDANVDLWMKSGTSKKRVYYQIAPIVQKLSRPVRNNLLGFHAFTGCDVTSSFYGYGKRSCWKVYVEQPELLANIGRDGSTDEAEKFLCHLYGVDNADDLLSAKSQMFEKGLRDFEKLPPTFDAFEVHHIRSNHQAKIWYQADKPRIAVEAPEETGGWKLTDSGLEIVWMRLPAIPASCTELVTCACKSKCRTSACKCSKSRQNCIPACGCDAVNCNNDYH